MPPGHAKSTTVSRFFAAWYVGTHPKEHIGLASYGALFAARWGRRARAILTEYGAEYFGPQAVVNPRVAAATDWETVAGGGMVTTGIRGGLTGHRLNVLLIDDPVKDAKEAASETFQEDNWEWYETVGKTRLEPGGSIVVIQTRWHEADLSGKILDSEGEEWTVISLPAIAEDGDLLGRKPGEPLWAERFPLPELEKIRAKTSAYNWGALYQQRPSPATGNIFDRRLWRRFHPTRLPVDAYGAIFVDTAEEEKDSADYSVIATWVTSGLDFYCIRLVREHYAFPDLVQAVMDARNACPGLPVIIEAKSNGKALIQTLKRLVPGILGSEPVGSKWVRAQAVTPYQAAGNCYIPIDAPWAGDFIEEHAAFPNGKNDDMVDTTSMALTWLSQRQAVQPEKPTGSLITSRPNGYHERTPMKAGRA